MTTIQLYDYRNIDSLSWENYIEGDYAKRFLLPLVKEGVHHYVENIETQMMALVCDNYILPITVNNEEYQNSYVCSPYGHYISYALDSLDKVKLEPIKKGLSFLMKCFGGLLKLGKINKVVMVNNWLFSTNLYPKISNKQMEAIKDFLKQKFPQHAIMLRSIDTYQTQENYQSLKDLQFKLIASRFVFFTNTKNEQIFQTRIFKSDLKLFNEIDYEIISQDQLSKEDLPKILELYQRLYLGKYSTLNPKLNQQFMNLVLDKGILQLKALRKQGEIDGVVGYFERDGVMTSPFFGYDLSKPQNTKLYRILSTLLTLEAKRKGVLLHQSSGASFYKSVRRAEGNLEYSAVYCNHLPLKRRIPWNILQGLINTFGVPFMKKY